MALSLNEKLSKMLAFLVALRDPRIFAVMAKRGMTQEILDEGWTFFSTAAGAKLRYQPATAATQTSGEETKLLADLDGWENEWFPVIEAVLRRHFPALYERVFLNLSQTEGKAVIVSVSTMLERLRDLEGSADGKKALALLEARQFNAEARKPAEEILAKLRAVGEAVVPEVDALSKEEQEKALVEAWGWYREWSTIARTLITRGDVLIRMGLRRINRSGTEEDVDLDVEEPVVGGQPTG